MFYKTSTLKTQTKISNWKGFQFNRLQAVQLMTTLDLKCVRLENAGLSHNWQEKRKKNKGYWGCQAGACSA